ncbi:PAS domain S-box-containing protein [Vogesella perlucida]|nr:PAS domain S-box-containing protein [Vogesella perlucida]
MLNDPPAVTTPRRLWVGATLILLGLLAALSGLFWVVYKDWRDEQRDGLIQELLWLEQSLRLHLENHQQSVEGMEIDMPLTRSEGRRFYAAAALLQRESKEIESVQWVGPRGEVLLDGQKRAGLQLVGDAYDALWRAERLGRASYSPPYLGQDGKYRFDFAVPVFVSGRYVGGLRLVYRMDLLLQYQVPWWIATKYHISLVDLGGKVLASKFDQSSPIGTLSHELSFDPPGYGLNLRAITYRAGVGFSLPVLSLLIGMLVVALLFSLWRIRGQVRVRARAERALQREMSLRQAVEDSMKSGLIAFGGSGQILRVNRAMCELTGLTADELVGQQLPHSFWADDDHEVLTAAMQAMLAGQLPEHGFELPFRHRDGEKFEVRLYATPLVLEDGRHDGWVASMYDITELKKKRLALDASHRRFLAVLNGVESGLCVIDGDGFQLLYANPAFAAGWAGFTVDGSYCPLMPGLSGAAQVAANLESSPDGGRSWFQLQYRRIDWVGGEPAWLCMLLDITDARARAERELAQEERFQTTSRLIAMGEMASSLAHELNQPLTAISTYSSGLARRLPAEVAANRGIGEAVQAIAEQARRAGQIVNSIRAFVKKHAPQLELCDPELAVRRVQGMAQPMADKYGVRLHLEPARGGVRVEMDPVLIEQVLLNLIKNAIEAMREAGSLRPTVHLRSFTGQQFWRVEVQDNGPGLQDAVKENLFTPFYSTKTDGMGIGLNICRSIVEFHRGEFGVSTPVTGGCVFWFTLPVFVPPAEASRLH